MGKPFFLDTGSFDGRQARTRRQIDELKKKGASYERERDALEALPPKRAWYQEQRAVYRREIERCWRKYEQRNRALAHLASNVLTLRHCQVPLSSGYRKRKRATPASMSKVNRASILHSQ